MEIPETEIVFRDGESAELVRRVLRPGDYVIGRNSDCDLQVEADLVSRRHARLTINFDHLLLEDLGSSNGTFVNSRQIAEITRLWPNQKVQIGSTTLEYHRVKTMAPPDVSLAPTTAAVKRLVPEEILHDKKYDIGGVVAEGGMGSILSAKEAAIDRTVAMKVMLPGWSPDDLTRFVAEAKITGKLEHPNIVPIHELGVDENNQVFYTMKFVRGVTLKAVIEQLEAGDKETIRKYPLTAMLTIFQKVCDAVGFAQSKGVIHRDIKPENIMLGDFGEVLLMDWGLAKVSGERPAEEAAIERSFIQVPRDPTGFGSTLSGTTMGTPHYMAPEQARGEVETLDGRADVYSLGATLYQMLSLRNSVSGDTQMEVVAKVSRGEIEPLVEAHGSAPKPLPHLPGGRIPASLAAVVRKAMDFDKKKRYSSVVELQRDIAAYQNGFATSAEHASFLKQVFLLIQRNKGIFATGFAAWFIITALAIWFVINLRISEQRATEARAVAVREKEATRRALAKADLALADSARRDGGGPEMQKALDSVPPDLRDSTWSYLAEQADTSIGRVRVTGTNASLGCAAADPTSPGVFAVVNSSGTVSVQNVHTGQHLLDFKPPFSDRLANNVTAIALSPDGEQLAVGRKSPGGIMICSARNGTKLAEWAAPVQSSLEFSPDGKLLLGVTHQGGTGGSNVWDSANGKLAWNYSQNNWNFAAFTLDGKNVLTFNYGDNFRLCNAQDGTQISTFKAFHSTISAFAMGPDGKTAVAEDALGYVTFLDLKQGRILSVFRADPLADQGTHAPHIAFIPGGGQVVTVALLPDGRQNIQLWNPLTGERLRTLAGGSGGIGSVAVHPVSGELLVAGAESRAWSVTGLVPQWVIKMNPSHFPESPIVAFWNSDDLLFASTFRNDLTLNLLQGRDWTPVWGGGLRYCTVSVSGDGKAAAFFDLGTNRELRRLHIPGPHPQEMETIALKDRASTLRVSPNGGQILAIDLHNLPELLDTATGAQLVTLDHTGIKQVWDAGWLGPQRIVGIATVNADRGRDGSAEQIVLWDAVSGKMIQTAANPSEADVLAVAPDGTRFAEAGANKMVRIRDTATLAVIKEFRAHDAPVTGLAWHPLKPIIATASEDLSIKIWNVDTGKRLEEIHGILSAPKPPSGLAFSPSGRRLACATLDDATRIWEPSCLSTQPSIK